MTLVKLYLKASKKAKDVVAEKFQLKQPLYFSFTHMVCRTAKDGECFYGSNSMAVLCLSNIQLAQTVA